MLLCFSFLHAEPTLGCAKLCGCGTKFLLSVAKRLLVTHGDMCLCRKEQHSLDVAQDPASSGF